MNFRIIFFGGGFAFIYFLIESTSSLAGGTWAEVIRRKLNMPDKNISGYVNYIDIDSIKKRGNIVYFDYGFRLLDNNGFYKGENPSKSDHLGTINCKDKSAYLTRNNGTWVPLSEIESKFWIRSYPIVCTRRN